jgi:hypothetical protein
MCRLLKIVFPAVFFLFLTIKGMSQGLNWCPQGASWKYEYSGQQGEKGYVSIDYVGDTVIDGKACQVLSRKRFYVPAEGSPLKVKMLGTTITYYTDKVVYVWDDYNEDFDTLFFFSTHAGDRYPVAIAPVFSQPVLMRADVQSRLILKTIDNENLIGSEVQFDVKLEDGSILSRIDTLADNIGIVSGYFFPASLLMDYLGQSEGGRFRCYSVAGKIVYRRQGAPDCDYINALDSPEPGRQVRIVPQPVANLFTVIGLRGKARNQNVSLMDLTGHTVSDFQIIDGQGRVPDILPDGIYFLHFKDDADKTQILKVILQH